MSKKKKRPKAKRTNLYYELADRQITEEQFAGLVSVRSRSVDNWCYGYCRPFPKKIREIGRVLQIEGENLTLLFEFREI